MRTAVPPVLDDVLALAARQVGLDARGARLIHHYANAVFLLPVEGAVARVAHSSGRAVAAQTALDVTGWLVTEHDFPATRPLPDVPAVAVGDDCVVTFWAYYPQPEPAPRFAAGDLAAVLRRLHDLPPPGYRLPRWRPLTSVEATVRAAGPSAAFSSDDRAWVLAEIESLRTALTELSWPLGHGLIHGDAWAGNLLADIRDGQPVAILGDWDGVAHGPREIDLAPTWHAATRYGRGPEWSRSFADVYGYDLGSWPGHPLLMRMRDLMQLTGPLRRAAAGGAFERALQERITGLRSSDPAVWRAL